MNPFYTLKSPKMLRSIPTSKYVLDFAVEVTVPEFKNPVSLMVGAGDLIHDGILNVEKFSESDVFFCNAWDIDGSFKANIDYLEAMQYNKIICVVDYHDYTQRRRFIEAFKGRFYMIDGHGGHVPHFTVAELEELLTEGGEAVNIHEKSETMLPLKDAKYFLENGFFPGYIASHSYLTGRIYDKTCVPLTYGITDTQTAELEQLFIENIRTCSRRTYLNMPSPITLDTDILENLHLLSLSDLQQIAACFHYHKEMPLNMRGRICMNARTWRHGYFLEIVLKKVPIDFTPGSPMDELRVARIVEAIKRDMERKDLVGQWAKYRTLTK